MPCPKCGANEPHFVPPSLGEPGFFTCECEQFNEKKEPMSGTLLCPKCMTTALIGFTESAVVSALHTRVVELEAEWAADHKKAADMLDRVHAERDAILVMTRSMECHPKDYEGPCECKTCMSYATDDSDQG